MEGTGIVDFIVLDIENGNIFEVDKFIQIGQASKADSISFELQRLEFFASL